MEQHKTDRILIIVGLLLVVAVVGWIIASSLIPVKAVDTEKIQKKYTSSGKAFGESKCCKNDDQISARCQLGGSVGCQGQKLGCQKACSRSGYPSCGRLGQS
ncbi:hypothetical protein [Methanospirillum lacunae]|uniref:Uncharacterized protein n=1 Tax=Methanospirillum lacunae TaxID=668570 RepID=A0A2V2MNY1_9EURY|nr:hypothetical protein [Methanospirillum lacunae]PWR69812.1 hypothetical protein DK846_16685 [Methanospirillum lacunae]